MDDKAMPLDLKDNLFMSAEEVLQAWAKGEYSDSNIEIPKYILERTSLPKKEHLAM